MAVTDDMSDPRIKKFFRKGLKGLGYDLRLWLVFVGIMPGLVLAMVALSQYGWSNHFYYSCGGVVCENPWFEGMQYRTGNQNVPVEMRGYVDQQYFKEGFSVGLPPPAILDYSLTFLCAGLFVALVLNHYIYNRRPSS